MKQVLFIMPALNIGGSAVSLMNLLSAMNLNETKIDVFLMIHNGNIQNNLSEKIHLLPENKRIAACLCPKKELLKAYGLSGVIHRMYYLLNKQFFGREKAITYEYKKAAKHLSGIYDVVIPFQEDMATNFAQYIYATTKYAWVHNDYEKIYGHINSEKIKKMYTSFKKIVCVSSASRDSFIAHKIKRPDEIEVIYNTMNVESIKEKSLQDVCLPHIKQRLRIVSVGRFAEQKAFHRIPQIASMLKESGLKFEWIVVGDGDTKEKVVKNIARFDVEEQVILVGAQPNPYPYIKSADVLVITSFYEAHPMVANEALILGTPVISTEFSSTKEVIDPNKNGIICENSVVGVANAIKLYFSNENLRVLIQNNVKSFRYNNDQIVKQVYGLIENG